MTDTQILSEISLNPDSTLGDCQARRKINKIFSMGLGSEVAEIELRALFTEYPDWENDATVIRYVSAMLAQQREYEKRPNETIAISEAIPTHTIVISDRHLQAVRLDILNVLYEVNDSCPSSFWGNSGLVRIVHDAKGRPAIDPLGESALAGILADHILFWRESGKEKQRTAVTLPKIYIQDILSLGQYDQFPKLTAITEIPVVRPDGTILIRPGYDTETALYYCPNGINIPEIPSQPTTENIGKARELLEEIICDFPFLDNASRANTLGTMLTPFLRPALTGSVPFVLFDKPQQGTGATKLASVISIIATGHEAAIMTAQKDDEGWRKSITSLLMKGQLVVVVDNIENTLAAASLAALLTATSFQDRVLGRNEIITLENKTTWLGTGNNIRLGSDLPRRCIRVKLDAHLAQPWLRPREQFKHPLLEQWVFENRGNILTAVLTIIRAWQQAGKPKSKSVTTLGGFEDYCDTIGGILEFIGVTDFLGNLQQMYSEMDTDSTEWEAFLQCWHENIGERPITTTELIGYLNADADLKSALPTDLADTTNKSYVRSLASALKRRRDVTFSNGLTLINTGKGHGGYVRWMVSQKSADSPKIGSRVSQVSLLYTHAGEKKQENTLYRGGESKVTQTHPSLKDGELPPQRPTIPCVKSPSGECSARKSNNSEFQCGESPEDCSFFVLMGGSQCK